MLIRLNSAFLNLFSFLYQAVKFRLAPVRLSAFIVLVFQALNPVERISPSVEKYERLGFLLGCPAHPPKIKNPFFLLASLRPVYLAPVLFFAGVCSLAYAVSNLPLVLFCAVLLAGFQILLLVVLKNTPAHAIHNIPVRAFSLAVFFAILNSSLPVLFRVILLVRLLIFLPFFINWLLRIFFRSLLLLCWLIC